MIFILKDISKSTLLWSFIRLISMLKLNKCIVRKKIFHSSIHYEKFYISLKISIVIDMLVE